MLPKDKSLPCGGKSTLPIKIQFVNGFGKLKPQGSDREVQMETTSVKIDKAVGACRESLCRGTSHLFQRMWSCDGYRSLRRTGGQGSIEFAANEVGLDLEIDKAEIPADGKSQATVSIMVKCTACGAALTWKWKPTNARNMERFRPPGLIPSSAGPATLSCRCQPSSAISAEPSNRNNAGGLPICICSSASRTEQV